MSHHPSLLTGLLDCILDLTCIGFHPGWVEPASSRVSTASRTIAPHVCWSWARSHKMASQLRFHHRRPTIWGFDSAARSSLIVLAYVFSCSPTCFCQLGREVGRSTLQVSSPSGHRSACPNHRRQCWSRTGGRGRRFRRWCRVVVGTWLIQQDRRM